MEVGDRVVMLKNDNREKLFDLEGTIIIKDPVDNQYCVEFDEYISGHDGAGRGKDGHCWWVLGKEIKLVSESDVKSISRTRWYKNGRFE